MTENKILKIFRFGRANNMLRFGRAGNVMRFGKKYFRNVSIPWLILKFFKGKRMNEMDYTRSNRAGNVMRFGKKI